jgi:hypothetical protein
VSPGAAELITSLAGLIACSNNDILLDATVGVAISGEL